MHDKYYKKLYNKKNLYLAWIRIKTGQNIFYKNYYRDIFAGYEIAQEKNLTNLSDRIKGGSYHPSKVIKYYIPKSSGLHRPITFLHLDDLIVYQALANIIIDKYSLMRKDYEMNYVYSNILNRNDKTSIFLFNKWNIGYRGYRNKIKNYYEEGNKWVAHFDLAAYYDTIDHYVLRNQISKKSFKDFTNLMEECLEKWSNQHSRKHLHHSIPQGPISSAVLGEVYLLPIDIALAKKKIKYVRYVDDIKIMGNSKEEVLSGVIILERECKERGLIPQAKKYELTKAECLTDVYGKNPSLSSNEKKYFIFDKVKTAKLFKESLELKTYDTSRLRYILKTIGKNIKILDLVLNNLSSHPEISDEFCIYLMNYVGEKNIAQKVFNIMLKKPTLYEYVEGKYWELLANYNIVNSLNPAYIKVAIERLKKNYNSYALKYGIYKYLCSSKNKLIINWIIHEDSSLIQGFIIPYISHECLKTNEYEKIIPCFLKRTSYEPGLMVLKSFLENNLETNEIFNTVKEKSGVIANTLGRTNKIDSIGQIISSRYCIQYSNKWNRLLKTDYLHSNKLLFLSENAFFIDRNAWVSYLDTFNDILIRSIINLLNSTNPSIKWPKTVGRDGKNIDYGVLLDKKNEFSKNYPILTDGLRFFHERRCKTPTAHAYDKKTSQKTNIITSKEQRQLLLKIKNSYESLLLTINV